MPTLTIEYSESDAKEIAKLLQGMRDPWSDEPMTLDKIVATLVEDIAIASDRPGSWEGHNMNQVLISHGWLPVE
jgi:hypothetical protein